MKKNILKTMTVAILLIATIIEVTFAQNCDPILSGMTFTDACLSTGSTTTLEIGWSMGGSTSNSCDAPAGSWVIQISLPATVDYETQGIADISGGTEFDWSLEAGNTIQGINNTAIGWLEDGTVTITIYSVASTTPLCALVESQSNLFILSSIQGGSPGSFDNDPLNDEKTAGLGVDLLTILPVELLSFTGRKVDKVVQLDWTTVTEQNNEGFEIHKSADGRDWDIIGWVKGNGTTTRNIDYSLIDKAPFIGDNYYRLKQFDFDGRFEFSNTIIVKNLGKEPAINILPNPSSGPFTVAVENPNNEKMRVTLYDSAGQLIWKSGLIEDKKVWRKDFNLEQKEMYFISVEIGKEVITEKILIIDRA